MLSEKTVSVKKLNTLCADDPSVFVEWSEDRYQEQVRAAASQILAQKKRIVLIAGPSSSGKTTTSFKIQQELSKLGVSSHVINMDDFFVDASTLPLRSDGKPDIENIVALDVEQIGKCLQDILEKGRTKTPQFDFVTHKRKQKWVNCILHHNEVVLMEGIHALNPQIYHNLDQTKIFKIFVYLGANFVDENDETVLSSRDLRLLRRMARDERERSVQIEETLEVWDEVIKGEETFILPYANNADFFLNTLHYFEPLVYTAILYKKFISQTNPIFEKYKNILENFSFLPTTYLPKDSMVREFVGQD